MQRTVYGMSAVLQLWKHGLGKLRQGSTIRTTNERFSPWPRVPRPLGKAGWEKHEAGICVIHSEHTLQHPPHGRKFADHQKHERKQAKVAAKPLEPRFSAL